MKKLKLELDALEVESFAVGPAPEEVGTVRAHATRTTCPTEAVGTCGYGNPTCDFTCGCVSWAPECTLDSCDPTCRGECTPTCDETYPTCSCPDDC